MLKYSLCLEPIFTDVSFYDRIAMAKDLGFDAIELWDPFQYDRKRIALEAQKADLPVVACTLKGSQVNGLNAPCEVVLQNVMDSIECGKELGCMRFICLSGNVETRVDSQKNILIENLKRVDELLEKENASLVLEPLNSLVDHKGYYLDSACVGFEIIKCVNSSRIKLLYDVYHMQIMEGNIIQNMTRNVSNIGHIHMAGVPGRHELQLGETDYRNVIKAVDQAGYDGYFGLEYWPSYEHRKSAEDVLKYLKV